MSTVLITNFNEENKTINYHHQGCEYGEENVDIKTLINPIEKEKKIKNILIVKCKKCGAQSFYPISGGIIAQTLHKLYLGLSKNVDIENYAKEKKISIEDKTKECLILEIIKDECKKANVKYLLKDK